MTGPRVDVAPPTTRILTPGEFDQAQSLTGPGVKAWPGGSETSNLTRIMTPDEFDHASTLSGPAVKALRLPAIPPLFKGPDVSGRDASRIGPGKQTGKPLAPFDISDPSTYANPILRQLVNPAMENPFATAAMLAAAPSVAAGVASVAGAAGASTALAKVIGDIAVMSPMIHNVAAYGWQKAAEMTLDPEDRKRAQEDPDRVSGEAAIVQAAGVGLAALAHVGLQPRAPSWEIPTKVGGIGQTPPSMARAARSSAPADVSGMEIPLTEAGRARQAATVDARKNAAFASGVERRAGEAALGPGERPSFERPAGFIPRTDIQLRNQPRGVKGYSPNNPFNELPSGERVKPLETQAVGESLQTAADTRNAVTASVKDYEAQRVAEEQADLSKTATPDLTPRRRAQPATNFFEHPTGAETLGAAAARHGLPETANPYHPDDPNAPFWQEGHQAAVGSFHEGFAMGGSESRIPPDYSPPKTPGFEPTALPEGATQETLALGDALKPNRYRAYARDDLASALLDAQKAIEDAQTNYAVSTQRGLVGEAAQADMENRGTSYSDEHEFAAKTAKKALDAAKERMKQIEREFAMRGVRGDELADVMKEAKDLRTEREAMQQEETLQGVTGEPAPVTEPVAAGSGLAPVAGTGETVVRGVARSIEERALRSRVVENLGDLPTYQRVNFADQSAKALDFLAADPESARLVALGELGAPTGLLPEVVSIAVENKAIAEGDVATLYDLKRSKLVEEGTTMGQRIAAHGLRDPESPVAAMQRIDKARMASKDVTKATNAEVSSLERHIAKMDIAWSKFVDAMRC